MNESQDRKALRALEEISATPSANRPDKITPLLWQSRCATLWKLHSPSPNRALSWWRRCASKHADGELRACWLDGWNDAQIDREIWEDEQYHRAHGEEG
jgi:hypothetical protein